jgi:phthalate 4,5-dioxygenase oxygenase subunit
MLSREENELLCRVGPGTPMGQMLRRYWIPATPTEGLEAGGAPRPVRLLGEDLIVFRAPEGTVGVLDEHCPHRGASLRLARNETCGLRCLYHGWKIDASGRIRETPPEPDEPRFRDRIRAVAYPCYEAGGLVWVYLGPPGTEPPRLTLAFTQLPSEQRMLTSVQSECNFVQSLEGVLDSAHSNYLHSGQIRPAAGNDTTVYQPGASVDLARPSQDGRPRLEVRDTDYGFRYAAIRIPTHDPDRMRYVRVTQFIAPFYTQVPAPPGTGWQHMFVPVDDENTMFHYVRFKTDGVALTDDERTAHQAWGGTTPGVDVDASFRKTRRRENAWLQDRAAMRAGSWSGITGTQNEDFAMAESMGAVYDRTKEHLGTSDVAVIRMRRLMLDAVRRFTAGDGPPLGLAAPVDYARIRAEEGMIPIGASWEALGAPPLTA